MSQKYILFHSFAAFSYEFLNNNYQDNSQQKINNRNPIIKTLNLIRFKNKMVIILKAFKSITKVN